MNAFAVLLVSILCYFCGIYFLFGCIIIYIAYKAYKYSLPYKFHGKVVLITGASSGLGEALSHELYKQGCKVILAARRLDQLERVKADLEALSCSSVTYEPVVLKMDLSELDSLPGLGNKASGIHGCVDILINNAGIVSRGPVLETNLHIHQKVMDVNYFGQICLTKALLPGMISRKNGQIVMMNSVLGKISIPFRSPYCASKHALQAYTDSLRAELSDSGVNVLSIHPGYVNTPISLNGITTSGNSYGKTDEAIENGYDPQYVVKRIINGLKYYENEVIIAPIVVRLAVFIRNSIPDILLFAIGIRGRRGIY